MCNSSVSVSPASAVVAPLRPTLQVAKPIYKQVGEDEIVVVGYEIVTILLSEVQAFYDSYPCISAGSEVGKVEYSVVHKCDSLCGYFNCREMIANRQECYEALVS